jgi:urease alpha subunit
MSILPLTQVIAGEKLIVTAGAIDAHVHYICTELWREVSGWRSDCIDFSM